MATTFHPNKSVNAKPLHSGTVIYADNICIRALSAEHLGGGGLEMVGTTLFILSLVLWAFLSDHSFNTFSSLMIVGVFLILLSILLFRYKPNYLILSRKSQEVYYVKSPKWIVRMKWKDVVGEYSGSTVFTGSAASSIETLRINGTSQYGKDKPIPASLPFVVADGEHAQQLWSYFQNYMRNGVEGLEPPFYSIIKDGFWNEAKRVTKQILYDAPKMVISSTFDKTESVIIRIFILPLGLMVFPFAITIMLPVQIVIAFVSSTRKRAPFPDDLLPYITDNPESWGKEK